MSNNPADKAKKAAEASIHAQDFRSHKYPLSSLTSFMLACEAECEIDKAVLAHISGAIKSWFRSGGGRTLDDILKINPQKLAAQYTVSLQRKMFYQLAMLIKLGEKKGVAADKILRHLETIIRQNPALRYMLKPSNAGRNCNGYAVISKTTLLKYWNDRDADRFEAEERARDTLDMWKLSENPELLKRNFLKQF